MSVESMSVVLHHSRAKGSAKLLLLGIANHDGDGGAWPTVAKLAIYMNVHPRNVQRAIERVEACSSLCPPACSSHLGELAVELQRGGTLVSHASDWVRPNRYVLTIDCPEGCAGGTHHRPRSGWVRLPSGDYVPSSQAVDKGVAIPPPGGSDATRPGGSDATHNRHNNPSHLGSASTTGRVSGWCDECGLTFDKHLLALERGTYERHNFTAARGRDAS